MAVTHRASIAAATANPTTTFTITIPATVQVNDVLFVHATNGDATAGSATPSCEDNDTGGNTWTLLTNTADKKSWIWWKRATGATAGKTITVGKTGALLTGKSAGGVAVFSGAITSGNPFTALTTETNASGDVTHASLAADSANPHVCFVVSNNANDNTVTAVSGATAGAFTQRYEKLSTASTDCSSAFWSRDSAGATGNITWTNTAAGATYSHAFRIVPAPDFAGSQTAFGFYEDGTESGSTLIGSANTNLTRDVSSDSNVFVRVRIQETNGGIGNSTDDYQLYSSHNNGAYEVVSSSAIADQYTTAPSANLQIAGSSAPERGQSFKGKGSKLLQIAVQLLKTGAPSGNITCEIHEHSGTYGTSSLPTGTAIAVSDVVNASTLLTSFSDITFSFSGANQITLGNDTPYVFLIKYPSGDASNNISIGVSSATLTHGGNHVLYFGSYSARNDLETYFKATVEPWGKVLPFDSTNLTEAAATTNRLGAGTGSFVAGKVAEDGEVNDLALTASNYTELLFPVKLLSAQLNNNDTLDFRGYRNSAPLGAYSVTPRITVSKSGGTVTKKDGMFFGAA